MMIFGNLRFSEILLLYFDYRGIGVIEFCIVALTYFWSELLQIFPTKKLRFMVHRTITKLIILWFVIPKCGLRKILA